MPNHLTTWRTAAAVAAILPLGLSASPRLSDADLSVAGLGEHASQVQTARRLGRPSRVVRPTARDKEGKLITRWQYSGFEFQFDGAGRRYLVVLRSSHLTTARGAHVGMTRDSVVAMYGKPSHEEPGYLVYGRNANVEDTRGIIFTLKAGVVTKIDVGDVMSVD